MAKCPKCRDYGQWWEFYALGNVQRIFAAQLPPYIPASAVHYICSDCLAGSQHSRGGERAQPEISQRHGDRDSG